VVSTVSTADLMASRPYPKAMLCSEGNKECIPSAVRVTQPRIAWHIEGIARDQGVWIHHLLFIVRYSRHSAVYLSSHIRIDPVQLRSHEMDARPLILLAAGFAALVYAARRIRKAWSASRGEQNRFRSFVLPLKVHPSHVPSPARSRATRSDWEFSYRLFPIPQCSIQLDDPDSIAWIANRLTGTERDPNTAVLPLTSARRNGIAHSSRSTKSGIAASLRHYSYFYVSPLVAVVGGVLAISVLCYQAGWTVHAIVSRVQELAAASGTDAKEVSASSSMGSSISHYEKRNQTGFSLTPSSWKRDIGHSPEAADGTRALRKYSSNDRESVLQPLVCTWFLYSPTTY
jgi:hypothetical protein